MRTHRFDKGASGPAVCNQAWSGPSVRLAGVVIGNVKTLRDGIERRLFIVSPRLDLDRRVERGAENQEIDHAGCAGDLGAESKLDLRVEPTGDLNDLRRWPEVESLGPAYLYLSGLHDGRSHETRQNQPGSFEVKSRWTIRGLSGFD